MKRKELLNAFIHSANCYNEAIRILFDSRKRDLSSMYPCLFLMRQYFELIIKALLIKSVNNNDIDLKDYKGHSLSKLLNKIKDCKDENFIDIINDLKKSNVVQTFDIIDKNGDYYRYPITTANIINEMNTKKEAIICTSDGFAIVTHNNEPIVAATFSEQQRRDMKLFEESHDLISRIEDRIQKLIEE